MVQGKLTRGQRTWGECSRTHYDHHHWSQATKSSAQSARDAIKKLDPWALPLATFFYWIRKGGAAALSWLSKNLWVVLIAVAIAYYYFRSKYN